MWGCPSPGPPAPLCWGHADLGPATPSPTSLGGTLCQGRNGFVYAPCVTFSKSLGFSCRLALDLFQTRQANVSTPSANGARISLLLCSTLSVWAAFTLSITSRSCLCCRILTPSSLLLARRCGERSVQMQCQRCSGAGAKRQGTRRATCSLGCSSQHLMFLTAGKL